MQGLRDKHLRHAGDGRYTRTGGIRAKNRQGFEPCLFDIDFCLCAVDKIRNDRYQNRAEGQQQQHCQQAEYKRPYFLQEFADGALGDAAGSEHHGAERRSNTADHDVDYHDKTEVDGIDAELLRNGQEQRGRDHQGSAALEEHTEDEKHDVAEHQEHVLVAGKCKNALRDELRDVDPAQILAENAGADHDEDNAGGTGDGIEQNGDEVLLEVKSAVDETADDEAVDNRNSAALGGSEHTEAHTDDDTEGEEQTPEGDERLLEYLGDLRELVSGGGVIALLCDDRNDDHHGQGHQDAGDIACGKDLAQRNLREQAVDDEVDSGRNDGGRSRRGGGDGRGERLGITTSLHLRNEHLGLHCAVGVCGTGAAAHQHGQQHVDLCKAAAHMTGNAFTEVH